MVTTVTVTVLQKIHEEEWIRIKEQGIHMVGHAVSVFEKTLSRICIFVGPRPWNVSFSQTTYKSRSI
jgi:hypothetical protein